jgi:predicted Zn-dependent peptidase
MYKLIISLIALLCLQIVNAQSPLEVRTFTLDNGLTVWLNEDHTQTSVFGAVVVKAGAKDSPATGIAHYFEHIMFKGTENIGTIDFESEKVYLDSISHQYRLLVQTTNDAQRQEIQREINRLSIVAAQYAIPNEFNNLIEKMGGSGLNAYTSFDETVYFNTFVPQYINQWLELNSERLINPVFRLFQSELETVYEEKNMYDDIWLMVAAYKALELAFKPHPYQYPIIGKTEHLKNPDLTAMEQFFRDYYVAGNMGLILSGDFNSEEVMPVITSTFGRLPAGNAPVTETVEIPPFQGRQTERILVPIPVVKASALAWRGVPNAASDENALNVAIKLLSNSNHTGYLDMLGTDGKLLISGMMPMQLNEAGINIALAVPKLLFQSYGKAERLVLNEINRIKNGDFTDEDLESVKLEMRREFETQLETFDRRGNMMINLFSQGKNWDDYLQEMNNINALTKEDIMKVANRYFTENYLYVKKKTGRYKIERVEKPGFAPILPPNRGESSEYAQNLIEEAATNPIVRPRTIDFENDVEMKEITPLVTLYAAENPVNNIFRLRLNYRKGNLTDNMVQFMSSYLNDLATDSLSRRDFQNGLRRLGATVDFSSNNDAFTINIMGFEENIEPTLQYVAHFMQQVKPDQKALRRTASVQRMGRMAIKREPQVVADALFNFVVHGNHSTYLTAPSAREIRRTGRDGLLDVFRNAIRTEADIHYSGNLPIEKIERLVTQYFNPENIVEEAGNPVMLPLQQYNRPIVFVIDIPKATQSIIFGYTFTPTPIDEDFINASRIFNAYFGGGMSSLMFQEIREFRSFAYWAASQYVRPGMVNNENGSYLKTQLSTQSDKTIEALQVLDSLLRDMPVFPEKMVDTKQFLRNNINNSYPSFRNISEHIASQKRQGFNEDINAILLDALDEMDMDTIVDFYLRNVQENVTCYVIVGNLKQIDMRQLEQFGEVRRMRSKNVVR